MNACSVADIKELQQNLGGKPAADCTPWLQAIGHCLQETPSFEIDNAYIVEVATFLHYLSVQADNEGWMPAFQNDLWEAVSMSATLAFYIHKSEGPYRDAAFFKDVTNLGRLLIRIGTLTYT
jgi:hypothetical protein